MAAHESVHIKWHSLLEGLCLLSEAKEPAPSADEALVESLLDDWESFNDFETLWSASQREGLPALVSALKKALAVALSQPAHSSGWLKAAVLRALSLCRDMLNWQCTEAEGWCTPKWRPLLDLLLAWAPSKVAGAWQDAAVEGRLQECAPALLPATKLLLELLILLLAGGAGEWAQSAALVQAVEDWLLVVDLATAEQGISSGEPMPAIHPVRQLLPGDLLLLVRWSLMENKQRPWKGGKTAELLAGKRQLLQALSRYFFHRAASGGDNPALYQPDGSTADAWLLESMLPSYSATCILGCPPLQPALLGLLTTSRSALEGLLHTQRLACFWTLAACAELESALAAPDAERVHEAAEQLRNVVELLSESSSLLGKLHSQQVQAGAPGTDETQAALYPGCDAALRALQLARGAVAGLRAQRASSATQQGGSDQEPGTLELCYGSLCAAYCAMLVQLQGLSANRYGRGIGRGAIVTPASTRCLVGSALLPTLRCARFVLSLHRSPLAARLLKDALPDIRRQASWAGRCSAVEVSQHLMATGLKVVSDHLEALEGRPERLAELGQELAEVAAELLAAQGRLLVLDLHGNCRHYVTEEFELHWDVLLGLAKLVGTLRERELVSHRVFQGLGYRGLCSLHHLLSIHSMRPPLFGVGREGEQAVLQCLRQMATSTVEVLASLQLRELTGATCLKECFAPLLGYSGGGELTLQALHAAMAALLEAYPRITASVVASSGLLVELAGWLGNHLEAVETRPLGWHSKLVTGINAIQQQVGRLVRLCCQAVDEAGGTRFLEEEQAIEAASKAHLQQLLVGPTAGGPRAAAVAASLLAWQRRRDELLPRLQRVVQHSTLRHMKLQAPAAASNGSTFMVSAGIPTCALGRDLAVSAAGCCANPWCFRPGVGTDTSPKWCCSACKSVLYCSAECAKQDWLRHGLVCQAIRRRISEEST